MNVHGMTAATLAGRVDLVPLLRRLEGVDAEIHEDERAAAVLALSSMGYTVEQITAVLNSVGSRVRETLRAHGVAVPDEPVQSSASPRAVLRAARREALKAQRVLIDGRWVHPDAPHGRRHSYSEYWCRCIPCTAANTASRAAESGRRGHVADR
jgi:hypothetical protein